MAKKKNPAAVALGRLGGSITTDAKAAAARANGAKGGRPRKDADLSPRALDLLRVIAIQHRSTDHCSLRTLSRALPHDPDWIQEDLDTLTDANLIGIVRRGRARYYFPKP